MSVESMNSVTQENDENASEPEIIFIKEEHLMDCDPGDSTGRSTKLEKPTSFCALCLRECSPDLLVRFSSQPKRNHVDVSEGQRKLEQVLGLTVALDDGVVVCRTCWKLVEIVGDFRESCLKSTNWMGQFSRGMQCEAEIDGWLSPDVFNSLEVMHKAIQDNRSRMELEEVIAMNPPEIKVARKDRKKPVVKEPEVKLEGFSDDENASHIESTPIKVAREDRKKPLVKVKPKVQMEGFPDDMDNSDKESTLFKVAKKGRKKPVVKVKPMVQLEDFPDDVDVTDNESTLINVARKGRKKPVMKVKPKIPMEGFPDNVDVPEKESSKAPNPAVALLGKDNHNPSILECEKCSRKFDGIAALRMHGDRCVSAKNTTYHTCSICQATFMQLCALRFHMNKHNGIRPLKCRKFCDRTFSSHYVRMKHESCICELDGRICSTCGAKLKNEFSLKNHIERVHGEAKYVCATCSMAFRTSLNLRRHQRVHSDERKYPCKVCEKAYKSAYAVKVHMRLHTQERPFACHLCDQAFNYKVSMKSHIERHHGQSG